MKIQLTNKKIVEDAIVVWNEHGQDIDLTMDLKKLSFAPNSVDEIYAFHVLDHLFPEEIFEAISNWRKCLKTNGQLFIVVDDFEYIARAFIGGDLSIELFNNLYSHPTQFTRDNLVLELKKGGFKEDKISIWFTDKVANKFIKNKTELVLDCKKHE